MLYVVSLAMDMYHMAVLLLNCHLCMSADSRTGWFLYIYMSPWAGSLLFAYIQYMCRKLNQYGLGSHRCWSPDRDWAKKLFDTLPLLPGIKR